MRKLYHKLLDLAICLFFTRTPLIPYSKAAGRCSSGASIYGKALKGLTIEKFKANRPFDCTTRCESERKCQSFNYVLGENVCELNNRTKEARPDDYVTDPARIYMTLQFNRGKLKTI